MSAGFGGPRLPAAPLTYSQNDQQVMRNELERRDDETHKRGKHLDIRVGTYVIMTSPDGTRYSVTVSNAGALVVTAL